MNLDSSDTGALLTEQFYPIIQEITLIYQKQRCYHPDKPSLHTQIAAHSLFNPFSQSQLKPRALSHKKPSQPAMKCDIALWISLEGLLSGSTYARPHPESTLAKHRYQIPSVGHSQRESRSHPLW